MSTNGNGSGESPHNCRRSRFERNRFYHGKLMTARDMLTEQTYHTDRLDTFAGYVAGEGIVDGLDVTVVQEETDDLTVTVTGGVAIDCCGRLLVVEDTTERTVPATDILDDGGPVVHLYLEYGECVTETVPLLGSESACETECEYNRVIEVFDVVARAAPADAYKRVPDVAFPDSAALASDERAALNRMAASYHAGGGTLRECTDEQRRVFLGTFRERPVGSGTWDRGDADLGYVYTNDLSYAAVARHVTRFDNPHEVTAEQTGGLESVEGLSNPGGNINIEPVDGTILVGRRQGTGTTDPTITLEVPDQGNEHVARYVMDKTLKYTVEAFTELADRVREVRNEAEAVAFVAETGLKRDEPAFFNADQFLEFMQEEFELKTFDEEFSLFELLKRVGDVMSNIATAESHDRYLDALAELSDAIDEEDAVAIAVLLDYAAETAAWLERDLTVVDFTGQNEKSHEPGFQLGELTFQSSISFVELRRNTVFPLRTDKQIGLVVQPEDQAREDDVAEMIELPDTSFVEIEVLDFDPFDIDQLPIEGVEVDDAFVRLTQPNQFMLMAIRSLEEAQQLVDVDTAPPGPTPGRVYTLRVQGPNIGVIGLFDLFSGEPSSGGGRAGRGAFGGKAILQISYQN